jgi:hypothetical protein
MRLTTMELARIRPCGLFVTRWSGAYRKLLNQGVRYTIAAEREEVH